MFNPASLLANTPNPASLLANPTLMRAQYSHHHNLNNMTNGQKRYLSPGPYGQQTSNSRPMSACGLMSQHQEEIVQTASGGSEDESQEENKENNGNIEEVTIIIILV